MWLIKTLIIAIIISLNIQQARCGIEPVLKITRVGNLIGEDSILELKDYYSVNNQLSLFQLYRATNRLRLEINHDNISECLNSNFEYVLKAEITKIDGQGTTTYDTVTLRVSYDQNSLEFITDASTFDFENSYQTRVEITSIIGSAFTPFIKLTLEMEIERYRSIDMANCPTLSSIVLDTATNDYIITWNPVTGAEEYDLEWLYQDNIDDGMNSPSSINIDFTDNATRVSVKQNYYRISNIFDKGYLVCRVRATTKAGKNFEHKITGPWSNRDFNPNILAYTGSRYVQDIDFVEIEGTDVHQTTLNWQLITTFAEEGLKKEVVTYMDGLFRARQTVTRNNTDTMAVVGDFYYDHQNRQTIAVLPVPAFDKKIKYHKNFNRVKGTDTILRPRNYLKDESFCTLPNPQLDSTSGSGRYYSSANPLISNSLNTGYGNNQYIPHAFGYTYTKTEYYPDPTNRIRRQSGVGVKHQIGGGHETQYIYATAHKEELDPLFGNDVGYSEHYQKQMVIDPNGQVSISFTNIAGKTIATALAGDNTSNAVALSSLNSVTTKFDLLSSNDTLYGENALSSLQELAVEKAGYYYFDYKVNSTRYKDACARNICLDCVYDLTISVKDECGNEWLDGDWSETGIQPLSVHIGKITEQLDIQCDGDTLGFDFNIKTDDIPDSIPVYLNVGKYTIEKILTVNMNAAEMYADSILKYDTCIQTVESYKNEILSGMDTWGCDVDCKKCEEELGSFRKFLALEKLRLFGDSNVYIPLYDSVYYHKIYDARKEICESMCTPYGPCDNILQMLEMDVSESGQYPGRAITNHPEYCHYTNCTNSNKGKLYDAAMLSVNDYTEALNAGYLNPLDSSGLGYTGGNPDPYFLSPNGAGKANRFLMQTYLNNVPDENSQNSGYSAWKMAVFAVKGNHLTQSTDINTFLSNNILGADSCVDLNNLMWQTFRTIYLNKKHQLYEANENDCYNVTIDSGRMRLFPKMGEIKDSLTEGNSYETTYTTRMNNDCDSNCLYQVDEWLLQLEDCDFATQAVKDSVTNALIKVCKYGCNDENPFGSSSVDLSKHATAKDRTFGDVLRRFGIYEKGICDTNLIDYPLPFNRSNHFLEKDTNCCACNYDTCSNRLKNPTYKKMARYYISQQKNTDCRECKSCDEISNSVIKFNTVYPGISVFANLKFGTLFENFLNNDLMFNLSYNEYINFMEECLGVQDSVYNDSVIYKKYLDTYNPVPFNKPTGYSYLNFEKNKYKNITQPIVQPDVQYASINGLLPAQNQGTTRLSNCYCDYVLGAIGVAFPAPGKSSFSDLDIDSVMKGVSCTFSNKYSVFRTCLAAAKMDTSFTTAPFTSIPIWNEYQLGYLNDEVLRDIYLDNNSNNDSLVVTSVNECDCPNDNLDTDPDTIVFDTLRIMKPFASQTCDTVEKWVDKYLSRVEPENRNNKLYDMLGNDIGEQFKFAKYLDSCYAKKGIIRGINYAGFDERDSNALSYYVIQILTEYFRCKGQFVYIKKMPDTTTCTTCYQKGRYALLLLNYLKQMTGKYQGVQNYISVKSLRLKPNEIKTYYETDLYYNGQQKNKLTNSAVSKYSTHYRKFRVADSASHNFYYELAFAESDYRYNFANILTFYDMQIVRNKCSSKATSFTVKAILKGNYPKLDTTLLYGTVNFINLLEPCTSPVLCNRAINELNYTPDSCLKSYEKLADYYAHLYHARLIDSLKNDIKAKYISRCRSKALQTEEFTVKFERSVYHYTLYYYDQLGNLIQTVPPAGVVMLSGAELDSVKQARKHKNRTPYYPSHTLITRYKYNTLNQLVWQSTPDAGQSTFWYDRLGRLVCSQNAQQNSTTTALPAKRYSYTLYDSLGRIKEVGELTNTTTMTTSLAYNYSGFETWVGAGGRTQITRTYYDRVKYGEGRTGIMQQNLRSRVASITIQQAEDTAYDEAVHYTYDIHGNVNSLVRENKQMKSFGHHLKKMDYNYDLISGKVKQVTYQKNKPDQYIHKYGYDAENRITSALTSTDNVHYETDARYNYYKHGPLSRTEIGRLYVQGVDYIYTLQGWLKGVNSTSLDSSRDPGKDGYHSGQNMYVAKDRFGFSLRYFAGDYTPVNLAISTNSYFDIKQTGSTFASASPDLYNGNISNMVTSIGVLAQPALGRAFKYDQLNRIKEAFSFTQPDYQNNQWSTTQASDSSWYENFGYDANGNITRLKRKGNNSSHYMMDNFAYNYLSGTNKLTSVDDDVNTTNYSIDIDDQSSNNYKYDLIGNLTADVAEGIDSIQWTVYGKIRNITRSSIAYQSLKKANLSFGYTPDGHRSTKGVSRYQTETEFTYYVRDAQGNVMAVYELNNTKTLDSSQLDIPKINAELVTTSTVETFADFAIDILNIQNANNLPSDYTTHTINSGSIAQVVLVFDAADYLLNVNTPYQNDVLANYSPLTIMQNLSSYLGYSTFFATIIPGVVTNSSYINTLVGFLGVNNFLNEWYNQNPGELLSLGSDYESWLITNSYIPPPPQATFNNLIDVQNFVATQSTSLFCQYLAQATGFHTGLTNVFSSIQQSDFIQQLSNIASITANLIQVQFTASEIFNALYSSGAATLWSYIISEVNDDYTILHYYELNHTTNYVKQCIIVTPAFIDIYITQTVSEYLEIVKSYYTTEQYAALMAALTEKYYIPTQTLQLAELHIYGSSRVGVYKASKPLALVDDETITTFEYQTRIKYRYNGKKMYELSNHLGNVLVTISDRRKAICTGDSTLGYNAVVLTANDYYSFGSVMIGREYEGDTANKYRYSFNGKEADNEVNGDGNQQDYGMRIYDPRLGRFLSVDPLTPSYPWYTPYQFAGNKPIYAIDLDGLEELPCIKWNKGWMKHRITKAWENFTSKMQDFALFKTVTVTKTKTETKWNLIEDWKTDDPTTTSKVDIPIGTNNLKQTEKTINVPSFEEYDNSSDYRITPDGDLYNPTVNSKVFNADGSPDNTSNAAGRGQTLVLTPKLTSAEEAKVRNGTMTQGEMNNINKRVDDVQGGIKVYEKEKIKTEYEKTKKVLWFRADKIEKKEAEKAKSKKDESG